MGKGERQGRKGTKKEGGTFSIFALPPFLSTTWMRRRRLSSPPSLPHNLEKEEEGILSFSFFLSTFRLSSLSFPPPSPSIPEDTGGGLPGRGQFCLSTLLLYFLLCFSLPFPPFFHFPGNCAQRRRRGWKDWQKRKQKICQNKRKVKIGKKILNPFLTFDFGKCFFFVRCSSADSIPLTAFSAAGRRRGEEDI